MPGQRIGSLIAAVFGLIYVLVNAGPLSGGGVIAACGVVGLVLAATGAAQATIAVIAGVLPGAVLLGFGWWGAHRTGLDAGQLQPTTGLATS